VNRNKILNKIRRTRTLLREKGLGSRVEPVVVTEGRESLPTIEDGEGYYGSDAEDKVLVSEVM